MKIKANNANSPIWKDVYSHSMLPEQLQPLYEMATNLWWVWNHEGAKLFGKIDSELWASTEGNPVLLLQSLSYKRIEEILADDVLMAEIKAVYSIFKDYVNVKPDQTKPSVAYFSMEYGLTNVLKIFSCIATVTLPSLCLWTDNRLPITNRKTSTHCPLLR